jgi:hypothetical protein
VRGGYGYLVDQPASDVLGGLTTNPPLSNSVSYNGAPIPVSTLYASAKASAIGISSVNPNLRNAYIESFNLNVQQALPAGLVASIYYVGSVGRHLRITTNENQATGPIGSPHLYSTLSPNSSIDPNVSIASNIPEVNDISSSNYNGMWATLSKSMSHGLEFNVNYEWTKSMDLNSLGSEGSLTAAGGAPQDSSNPRGNYGLSDFDTRNHFAGTGIYNLPFKGNRLVSGYQLSTIVQYQTGNPVNILASSSNYNGLTGAIRPNKVGTITTHKSQGSIANVTFIPQSNVCPIGPTLGVPAGCSLQIQATQATPTAPIVYTGVGDIQRNAVTGPGFADVDLSGEKDTKLFENLNFNLRVDAFDILNHPNFGQPSGNVQSSTFGQISATRFATSDGGSSRQLQISGKFIF